MNEQMLGMIPPPLPPIITVMKWLLDAESKPLPPLEGPGCVYMPNTSQR